MGLLYIFIVPLPLLAWAVRLQSGTGPQVVAIAGAVFVAVLVAGLFATGRRWIEAKQSAE